MKRSSTAPVEPAPADRRALAADHIVTSQAYAIVLNRLSRWAGSPGFAAVETLARVCADELRAAGVLRTTAGGPADTTATTTGAGAL